MKKLVGAAALAMALSSAAHAADWMYVADSVDGKQYFIDLETIASSGQYGEKTAWVRVDVKFEDGEDYPIEKILYSARCNTGEMMSLRFLKLNPDGSLIKTIEAPASARHKPADPDSIGGAVLEAICRAL